MKKVILNVPDMLNERIEKFVGTWGCTSKAEFFRYAAQTYLDQKDKITTQMLLKRMPYLPT